MEEVLSETLKQLVSDYQTPPQATRLLNDYPPFIVSGVTASGKNSLINYLVSHFSYGYVVSHTTRSKRPSDTNGIDYWFVSQHQMIELLSSNLMIEAKLIHAHAVYGTSIRAYEEVIGAGLKPALQPDVQGARGLHKLVPDLKTYFLVPPTFDIWMQRLHKRGTITELEKRRRLVGALQELRAVLDDPNFTVLINDEIAELAGAVNSNKYVGSQRQQASHQIVVELIKSTEDYLKS